MCGIFGIISYRDICSDVVKGIKSLEYRGYDSAGIALIKNNKLDIHRVVGKVSSLEELVREQNISSNIAIAHTRWATHGKPSMNNAHPHFTDYVAVAHNGIIENYQELKQELQQQGVQFYSETDSEVIPQMITFHLKAGLSPLQSLRKTLSVCKGNFAIAVIFKEEPNKIFAYSGGSPLVIGANNHEAFVASDATALSYFIDHVTYLADSDLAIIAENKIEIFNKDGQKIERIKEEIIYKYSSADLDNHSHHMIKEIFEQSFTLLEALKTNPHVQAMELPENFKKIKIIACGTSFYAALTSKYWFEKIAKIETDVEIASEFRYRDTIIDNNTLFIFISQSGETADTLSALKKVKEQNCKALSVLNAKNSTMERISDNVLFCNAGIEISVASTKVFTSQLMILALLVIKIALEQNNITKEEYNNYYNSLSLAPSLTREFLNKSDYIKNIASLLAQSKTVLYIGRGNAFPIALEGALKFKEISYIHAEGIPSGELKHGTLALVDKDTYVIAIIPNNDLFDKSFSNIQEIIARDGKIIAISDNCERLKEVSEASILMPTNDFFLSPIIYSLSVQLIAYYTALAKGCNIDKPRNLAKSVTVE